jgi:bifunctional DNase/RNase
VLEDVGGTRRLPIWVGRFEGEALALAIKQVLMPRPPTFAFTASILQAAGGRLREVVVNRLSDTVYYAQAIVSRSGKTSIVDARPSDAINLAVTVGAPIRVAATVFDEVTDPKNVVTTPGGPFGEGTAGATEIVAEVVGKTSLPRGSNP